MTDAFHVATQLLELEFKVHKLVLKQYERSVLTELGDVLAQCNQFLSDNGVLPDLTGLGKRRVKKLPDPSASSRPAASAPVIAEGKGQGQDGQNASDPGGPSNSPATPSTRK